MIHALVDVNLEKIPTIEEMKIFCQQKHVELMLLDKPEVGWVGKIANQFDELQRFLENKTSPDLVDAKTQLHFFLLLRDSMGRLNIGVLCCRLATVNNRFRDELKHILGWTPHYAARLAAVQGLQRQFARNIREIQNTVSALVGHKAFVEGKTTDNQIVGIKASLQIQINKIDLLKEIRPFCRWSKHCINDLQQAKGLVGQKEFTKAKEVLEKLIWSIRLRMIGFELEELIKEFSLGLVKKQVRTEDINTKIGSLASQFKQIDDSNFSQPVCQTILERLEEARTNLLFGNFTKAKEFLKSAVAPI